MDFFQFIESQGIDDAQTTALFVEAFLENPGIFFNLSESERETWVSRIDQILDFFRK